MQLLSKPAMTFRTVVWHGIEFQIPSDHVAIAADKNGWVYSFPDRPSLTVFKECWMGQAGCWDLCQVDLEGMPWQDTLAEYPL